ncbi:MAG: ATP-grasp domain-containing protein [Roseburia sp.]|nr:ATP-grasp domain-containing protein [Roseburia sp.]
MNEKIKKLVVIGANDFQNQLILKAKERGFETHVFAWREGAIGERTADYFYPISIIEKENILEECRKIQPDGVISIASDLAAITVNYVAEHLGLTGNGIESSLLATNKCLMRKAFEENGDPSPKNYCSDEITEEIVDKLQFPLIVKPVDRSGSRGITKVLNKKELKEAISIAEQYSFDKKAIVEEFIEGQEYSVEYISYRGKHIFLALTQKFTTGEPHFIETGHLQPVELEEEVLNRVKWIVEHALDTLKIQNGASHSEIKINQKGEIKIIEIGGRMGGDCIGSDLVQLSTGYDYVNMVIDVACGLKPSFDKVCEPSTARIEFIFGPDDMKKIQKMKRETPARIHRISEIEPFDGRKVIDSASRYGYIITKE